jgi:hypothetical protein
MYDEDELEENEENEFQKGCEMEQQSIKKLMAQGFKEFNADEYGCYYRKGKKVVIVLTGGKIKALKQPDLNESVVSKLWDTHKLDREKVITEMGAEPWTGWSREDLSWKDLGKGVRSSIVDVIRIYGLKKFMKRQSR